MKAPWRRGYGASVAATCARPVSTWPWLTGADTPEAAKRLRQPVAIIGSYLFTLWAMVTLVFIIPRALAGDPLAGFADNNGVLRPDQHAYYAHYYGLDRPLLFQYRQYLIRLAHGDLGRSISSSQPVTFLLHTTVPWTALLVGTSLILSAALSFFVGIDAAWRRGRAGDRTMLVVSAFLHALPDYVLAIFLLIAFGILVRVFPIAGGSTPFTGTASVAFKLRDVSRHLVLPAGAITLGLWGTNFLLVRNTTIGVLGQDFMLVARAKGSPEKIQKYHHAGRNVLLPFLNSVGTQVGFAVGGAVFVETVFAYPGVGSLMVNAVANLDYPVIQGCFLVLAFLVLTTNLAVDLLSAGIDPRVRTR